MNAIPSANRARRLKVVVVSTFYPNASNPLRTVFVRNLTVALARDAEVTVVAPVPRTPPLGNRPDWQQLRAIPAEEIRDGLRVLHPRFTAVPGATLLNGLMYGLSVLPVLRTLRRQDELDIVHAHCAYPDGVGVALAARVLRIPFVVTAHGSDVNVYSTRTGIRAQMKWMLRRAGAVIAVSDGLKRKLDALLPPRSAAIRRIPCAAADSRTFMARDRDAARRSLGVDVAGRIALFVGQLVPIKGLDVLLSAWAELLKSGRLTTADRLCLIGEGPLRSTLEQRAAEPGFAGTVQLLGGVSPSRVATWFNAANVACLSSRNEGTPNVIIEALASGVPVVATAVGGIPDMIVAGVNGELAQPNDVSSFAEALHTALTTRWSRERILETVRGSTWEALAERNLSVLEEVSARKEAA